MRHALLCAAVLSAACATPQSAAQASSPAAGQTAAQSASAGSGIEFIEDDLPKALALAKTQDKPLFVDAWAPW